MRKHGAAAPPEGVDHTRRRVHAPSELVFLLVWLCFEAHALGFTRLGV
jgi:hypothetical protein